MSNLLEHAKKELALMGGADDEMQQAMNEHILKMVQEFGGEGHSGFSASYALGLLEKLLRFKPITPLTGEDSEWNEVGDNTFQNNRCSTVFKEGKDGQAYHIDGNVFVDESGCSVTNCYSSVIVNFPWTPPEKPNYVHYFERRKE